MTESGIYAYVSNAKSKEIFALRLDPDSGALSTVQQVSVAGTVMPMAVSPNGRFLYAALRTEPFSVASFAIDAANGKLTPLGTAPLSGSCVYLCTDRTGRWLFGTTILKNEGGHFSTISINAIGPHGVAQAPCSFVRTEPKSHSVVIDPSNRYVFTAGCKVDLIGRHSFDGATGALSHHALPPVRVKPNAGPRHSAFHPNNRFFYLLNETDGSIYVFDYAVRTGGLRELQIASAVPPDFGTNKSDHKDPSVHAADIHPTPDGRFLYASIRASSTLAAFRVDPETGLLTAIGHFPTEEAPRGFNIDPYSRYLLAVGATSNSMTVHAIDRESGKLEKLSRHEMGKEPNWVEVVRLP